MLRVMLCGRLEVCSCYVSSLASGDYTTRTVVEQVSTFNH